MKKNKQTTIKENKNKQVEAVVSERQTTTDHVANTEPEKEPVPATTGTQGVEEIEVATERQSKAETETQTRSEVEAALQADIEEVDVALANLLSSANFVSGSSTGVARQANSMLAVVNHSNGKRVKCHKAITQKLGIQDGDLLNVTVNNKEVILLKSDNGQGIPLKKSGCLYSSELVNAITKEYAFDFASQSTHHLMNVAYKKWNDQVIAIITE